MRISLGMIAVSFLLAPLTLVGPAIAQQRTGSVDLICRDARGNPPLGNSPIALTIDYDRRKVRAMTGSVTENVTLWNDDQIAWEVIANDRPRERMILFIFDRRIGTLTEIFTNGGANPPLTCHRSAAEDRY